jgi:UPF0716 protein FxsA
MLSIQFIINVFRETKAVKILYFFLAISIFQVMDLFITIFLSNIFGEYLILAIICSTSLIGLSLSILRVKSLVLIINDKCKEGVFPLELFNQVTGVFVASIFIFIPGFITSITGFLFLIPFFSNNIGRYTSKWTFTDWHTVYEYMKI